MIRFRCSFCLSAIIACVAIFNLRTANVSAMTVSPATMKFSVSTDQPTSFQSVAIKNNGPTEVSYEASIVDVDTETGTLLPLESTAELTKKVFQISLSKFSLQPEQSINISVTANNLEELPPGGHYGALHIKQLAGEQRGSTVPINQVIGVGLFMVKEDGAIRDLTYTLSPLSRIWFVAPKSQKITVKNNGNVDVVPRGYVAISRGDKTYQKVLFNETSQPVFPYKSNEYSITFGGAKMFWPGRYTQAVSLRYDGQAEQKIEYYSVWYIPVWSIFIPLVLIVIVVLLGRKTNISLNKFRFKKKPKLTPPKPRPTSTLISDIRPPEQKSK